MKPRFYAGIGSRETPPATLEVMRTLAADLASRGFVLRSGAAQGADTAFEEGAGERVQLFIPWPGFNHHRPNQHFDRRQQALAPADRAVQLGTFAGAGPRALALAEQYHPAWERCSRAARQLHARNGYQVLGPYLDDPVEFVVCWTRGGTGAGGTGQALRIAADRGIPVLDLGDTRASLDAFLSSIP